jgi:hypothetical protein
MAIPDLSGFKFLDNAPRVIDQNGLAILPDEDFLPSPALLFPFGF